MSVKIRIDKGKYLLLDIYQSGIRKREKLSLRLTGDKQADKEISRLAEQVRLKRELQLFSGEYALIDEVGGKRTLFSYIQELSKTRDKKDSTAKILKYLKLYPNGDTIQLNKVTSKWIEDFYNYLLKDTKLSRNTASRYATAIPLALNNAVRNNYILKKPSVKGIPREEIIYDVLSIDEIQKLWDTPINGALNNEVKKAFIFSCYQGGLRISDLKSLKWENIEHKTDKTYLAKVQKKTRKIVKYELNKLAYEIIRDDKIHSRAEFVFPLLATTGTDTSKYFKIWALKAGIDKRIGWHTARRSNATLLSESGVSPFIIQKLLGHRKISTTQRYIQLSDEAVNATANILPEIKLNKKNTG